MSTGRFGRLATFPLVHTVLFAIYPVVFLWAQNLNEDVPARTALGLCAAMVVGALAVTLAAWLLMRDLTRAAFAGTIAVLSFALFGRVDAQLGLDPGSGSETTFLLAWIVLTLAIIIAVTRVKRLAPGLTRVANALAAVLVALNVVPIIAHASSASSGPTAAWDLDTSTLAPDAAGPARDVYYMIFDRYAGQRTLRDLYGFDDSAFFQGLRDRGFVTVDDALANYPQTTHSLASSLNMTMLDDLASEVGATSSDRGPLLASLADTTLSRTMQALGYRYVHIGSWWSPTWSDPTADVNYTYGGLEEFAGVFSHTTMWPTLADRLGVGASQDQWVQQYERVHYQIQKVEETARDPALTFTFAHFTLPHTPYVFHADGSMAAEVYRTPEDGYVDQLQYTNTAIDQIVDDLLAQPGPAPIIVVQSDEGPHPPQYDYAGNLTCGIL